MPVTVVVPGRNSIDLSPTDALLASRWASFMQLLVVRRTPAPEMISKLVCLLFTVLLAIGAGQQICDCSLPGGQCPPLFERQSISCPGDELTADNSQGFGHHDCGCHEIANPAAGSPSISSLAPCSASVIVAEFSLQFASRSVDDCALQSTRAPPIILSGLGSSKTYLFKRVFLV